MSDTRVDLEKRLARTRQIRISVTGRESGATITLPGVLEADKLYLLPVYGSDTGGMSLRLPLNAIPNRAFPLGK